MNIQLSIPLSGILGQVAQSTAYIGAKHQETPNKVADPNAFDRIETVDEDKAELMKFFGELRIELVSTFSGKVTADGFIYTDPDLYVLGLDVHDGFNIALIPVLDINLKNYFVNGIIARWLTYTHLEDVELYANASSAALDNLHSFTTRRTFERQLGNY